MRSSGTRSKPRIHRAHLDRNVGRRGATPSGRTIVVIDYKGYRVAIPLKEMMLYSGPVPHGAKYKPFMERMNGILSTMLTAEIDFIVRGLNHNERVLWQGRKAAMLRKRQTFYLDTNEDGEPLVYEGRVVQARVIGVAEKSLRVDVFGVECTIFARDLSNTWFGDAHEYYSSATGSLSVYLPLTAATSTAFPSQRTSAAFCLMPTRAIWISVFYRANMPAE